MIREAVARAIAGEHLRDEEMAGAMREILDGSAGAAHIAALAVALRMRGESPGELAAAARVMRDRAAPFPYDPGGEPLVDTCGTGGDGASTFNISTVSAIVVAACGVKVAKHGNRAVSSKAGSADLLEEIGVPLTPDPAEVARSVREIGIGFLFAPAYHGALRHAAPVRRELGVRTFFNLLGPLSNPAGATHQLVGVYDPARVRQMAEVLGALGLKRAWVVHGAGGLDEVSPCGETRVAALESGGEIREYTLTPGSFGLPAVAPGSLAGGDAARNAEIARSILAGEAGPPRIAVLMNAGAALCVAGVAADPAEGAHLAELAIDEGHAARLLARWRELGAPSDAGPDAGAGSA